MTRMKTYEQFVKESLTISVDQLPSIGDIVDRINWKEGEKIAFVDFKGIKNIPVHISNKVSNKVSDIANPVETDVESSDSVDMEVALEA